MPGAGRRWARRAGVLCGAGALVLVAPLLAVPAAAVSWPVTRISAVIGLHPLAGAGAGGGAAATAPQRAGATAAPHALTPQPGVSTNWDGEIESGTTFSAVAGSWTVPAVSHAATTPADGYSSSWVGIGGAAPSADGLIQTGTDQIVSGGVAHYGAWYEVITATPARTTSHAVTLGEPVAPGDAMSAAIHLVSGTTWSVTLTDTTQGWSRAETLPYGGTTASAEWIEEAPGVETGRSGRVLLSPLADFGSVTFGDLAAAAADPAAAHTTPVFMVATARPPLVAYAVSSSFAPLTPFTAVYGTPRPVVSFLTPSFGPSGGGSSVVVHGTWLIFLQSVSFGSTTGVATLATTTFGPGGATTFVAVAPAGSGTVPVGAATQDGPAAQRSGDRFTYGTPPPAGYDLVGSDGGVFVFDPPGVTGMGFYGSLPGLGVRPSAPIVGMVATTAGGGDAGYFLVGADGGVFSFGNAPFFGSLPGLGVRPAAPIVGIVAARTDTGYFLVGSDGGVFAFGTVPFLGSLPERGVATDEVVGIAATPSGTGYWVLTATGAVYAFGGAQALGSVGPTPSAQTAIAATPTGGGYWVVAGDGAVHAFGTAASYGTLPAVGVTPALAVVAVVRTAGTAGYWLVAADGGIFAFGLAPFAGSLPADGVAVTDVVGAVPIAGPPAGP